MIVGAVFAGDPEDGERVLQPARQFATPLADISARMPYRFFQTAFDPFLPKGELGSYWKSLYMPDLSEDATDPITRHGVDRLSPKTLVHDPHLGGAIARVGPVETPIGDREALYMLSVDGSWGWGSHLQSGFYGLAKEPATTGMPPRVAPSWEERVPSPASESHRLSATLVPPYSCSERRPRP